GRRAHRRAARPSCRPGPAGYSGAWQDSRRLRPGSRILARTPAAEPGGTRPTSWMAHMRKAAFRAATSRETWALLLRQGAVGGQGPAGKAEFGAWSHCASPSVEAHPAESSRGNMVIPATNGSGNNRTGSLPPRQYLVKLWWRGSRPR